jgi:hypothetical protein
MTSDEYKYISDEDKALLRGFYLAVWYLLLDEGDW